MEGSTAFLQPCNLSKLKKSLSQWELLSPDFFHFNMTFTPEYDLNNFNFKCSYKGLCSYVSLSKFVFLTVTFLFIPFYAAIGKHVLVENSRYNNYDFFQSIAVINS